LLYKKEMILSLSCSSGAIKQPHPPKAVQSVSDEVYLEY
jgi:hypothetical protein